MRLYAYIVNTIKLTVFQTTTDLFLFPTNSTTMNEWCTRIVLYNTAKPFLTRHEDTTPTEISSRAFQKRFSSNIITCSTRRGLKARVIILYIGTRLPSLREDILDICTELHNYFNGLIILFIINLVSNAQVLTHSELSIET